MRRPASTSPRKVPKQERSKETVEAILEATARVLVREGYEGATTNKIAEASGYGVGSLYDYFPNKESLVTALVERHAEQMVAVVESSFRADVPLQTAMRSWVEGGVRAYFSNPRLHKVLVGQTPRVGDLALIGGAEERIARLVLSYLQRHEREVQPSDLPLAAFVVAQAVMSLAHKAVAERPESLSDGRLAHEVTALALGYLAPAAAK